MNLEPEPQSIIPQLILIVLLTMVNAFFASAEMAIVSVNKNKIKKLSEEGNKRAKLLETLMEDPSKFLATIQVGITLAGFFSSASAATGISTEVAKSLQQYNIPYINEISLVGVTIVLSYITLVFGELVPKRVALQNAEKIALTSVKPVYFVSVITKPFIKFLSLSTSIMLKILGYKDEDIEEKVSEEEIRALISQSQEEGCIAEEEKEMINSVFEFNDKISKEIMTSRKDTYIFDIDEEINDKIDELLNLQYSRIPVYEDTVDNIIGILHIKDFIIEARRVGFENIDIRNILQKPYFAPENKKANELFKVLQSKRIHMALLIDEYGGFSGIVTMEDLIEEIMGDIEDEYDLLEDLDIKQIDENTFMIKGTVSVDEFNEMFESNIEEGEYDTLSGYIIDMLGEIPSEDQKIEMDIEKFKFNVVDIKNKRIESIKVSIVAEEVYEYENLG